MYQLNKPYTLTKKNLKAINKSKYTRRKHVHHNLYVTKSAATMTPRWRRQRGWRKNLCICLENWLTVKQMPTNKSDYRQQNNRPHTAKWYARSNVFVFVVLLSTAYSTSTIIRKLFAVEFFSHTSANSNHRAECDVDAMAICFVLLSSLQCTQTLNCF